MHLIRRTPSAAFNAKVHWRLCAVRPRWAERRSSLTFIRTGSPNGSVTAAVAVADTAGEVRYTGEIVNTPEAITKLVAQLKRSTGRLAFCYEAGLCGYTICRQLRELKQACQVIAPSLIRKK
ncbi:MAG: transposase, partial [Paraburkholderia sp.]|nr:transposase [Paraburkholderia sp.]